MTTFISVDLLNAKTSSTTDFISMMSDIEGRLLTANALNICGIPDSIDLDGFPERDYQIISLAEVIGEALERSLIPAHLLKYVDNVVLMGKRFDAEGETNAWSYGFKHGVDTARAYLCGY